MTELNMDFSVDPKLAPGSVWGFRGNPMIYENGTQFEWTEEMIEEYKKCATDPAHFVRNYIKITALERGLVLFKMYGYQEKILKTMCENRFTLCKLPRQSGKTTVVVGGLLWHLLFNRNYKIAVAANKMEQATEILTRLRLAYERLPRFLQQGLKIWNKRSIEFENLSSIKVGATTSSTIRGGTFDLIYLDEFCHVHPNMQEDFFSGALPAISSGKYTKVVITSTPKGMDLMYKLWMDSINGKNDYKRIEINWWDTPGRDEEWKRQMLNQMSEEKFDQEFNTEFIGSSGTLIHGRVLSKIPVKDPIEKIGTGILIFERPIKGNSYVITVDVSRGLGYDYQAFTAIDITKLPYQVVASFRNNKLPPSLLHEVVFDACRHYNDAMVLVETNDVGLRVAEDLLQIDEYENVIMTTVKAKHGTRVGGGHAPNSRYGLKTTVQTKKIGCAVLKQLIEKDQFIINDKEILWELQRFVAKGTGKYEAQEGSHDDLVMCLVIFAWMTDQQFFKENINNDTRAAYLATAGDAWGEDDLVPFGMNDGQPDTETVDEDGRAWTTWVN